MLGVILKTCLFQSYCLSFYSGALWRLSSGQIAAYNNCVSHTAIVHLVAELESVYNLLHHRFLKFACKALSHDSVLVQSALSALLIESCSNFIGIIFCMVHTTPEFIMTTKDSVVKLFGKSVPLTFMALTNLNSI